MAFALKSADHLAGAESKRFFNRELFREIAPKYDFVTRALSLGRDGAWKRDLIDALPDHPAPTCLDLACGTGDIAFLLAERFPAGRIFGADLTPAMLDRARARNRFSHVAFIERDMIHTRMDDASVDIITGGYALRNAPGLDLALKEIHRVLKPGGTAAFLDFSKPRNRCGQTATLGLLKCWGGFWGLALHRSPEVYAYIAKSLAHYPDRDTLREMITAAGFANIRTQQFYFGVVELILFRK